jgi:hypothetical protein
MNERSLLKRWRAAQHRVSPGKGSSASLAGENRPGVDGLNDALAAATGGVLVCRNFMWGLIW